ncbi:MAG: PAS domain S-box protein [Acidobacteriota bacterium]
MKKRVRTVALRYGLPVLSFLAILLIAVAIRRYFSITLDPTTLLIVLLIASAWYGGRGPGLLVALEYEIAVLYYTWHQQTAPRYFFLMLNRLILFISLVLFVSSRRKAQHRVEAERERLRVSLASIGDAVIATDINGLIDFINPTAETLTGWTKDQAVGKSITTVFNIVNEFTRQLVENPVAKVLREKTIVGLANHTILIAKGGREIPIDDSGAPIRLSDGKVVGVILVFRDVSERKRAEQTKAALAAIVESSDDAIFSKDLQGVILSWNQGAERLYGYTSDEVIGKSVALLMPPDRNDDFPNILAALQRGEIISHYETERRRKDGTVFEISLTVSPIRNAIGEMIGASTIAHDITEHKRLEKEGEVLLLREQTARQEAERRWHDSITLTEMSRELVAHLDTAQVTATLCRTVRKLLGCDGAAFILYEGESVFYADEDARMPLWKGRRFSSTNCISGWSIIHRMPVAIADIYTDSRIPIDEYKKTFVKSLAMMPVGPREPVAAIGAYWAHQHQASDYELDLLRAVASAADLALARAKAYEEMSAARARAEEANRLKDEFLATLSHELRTPLNAMMGWSRLIQGANIDDKTRKRGIEIIERSAAAQEQLIEDLLDVSRIIAGKLTLNMESLKLDTCIEPAIDSVRPAATAKDIQLHVNLDHSVNLIRGDAARLQQVVWNLLTNAIKFTPRGGKVYLSLVRNAQDVQLRVRDTGQGIKPEFLPYIFDRFRQQESIYTRQQGGLGLGLALVKHLVELHGGTIEAHSTGENQGATFIITLPLVEETQNMPTVENDHASTSLDSHALPSVRVLVVEDDPDSLELVRFVLEMQGAEVKCASRVSEAIGLLNQWTPQVVVSDIGLPDEDGYSLIRQLKLIEEEKKSAIPALALTGFAGRTEGLRAVEAGFQFFLTKPMEAEKLIDAVAKLVKPELTMKVTE